MINDETSRFNRHGFDQDHVHVVLIVVSKCAVNWLIFSCDLRYSLMVMVREDILFIFRLSIFAFFRLCCEESGRAVPFDWLRCSTNRREWSGQRFFLLRHCSCQWESESACRSFSINRINRRRVVDAVHQWEDRCASFLFPIKSRDWIRSLLTRLIIGDLSLLDRLCFEHMLIFWRRQLLVFSSGWIDGRSIDLSTFWPSGKYQRCVMYVARLTCVCWLIFSHVHLCYSLPLHCLSPSLSFHVA